MKLALLLAQFNKDIEIFRLVNIKASIIRHSKKLICQHSADVHVFLVR